MEDKKVAPKLDENDKELLKNFNNEERSLLICKKCGHLLDEVIIRRVEYVYESYILCSETKKLEYENDLDTEYIDDDEGAFYYCGHCDELLDDEQIEKLIDKDILY